jgi:hypothetical protein
MPRDEFRGTGGVVVLVRYDEDRTADRVGWCGPRRTVGDLGT